MTGVQIASETEKIEAKSKTSGEDILQVTGALSKGAVKEKLTPTQQAGMQLAGCVGSTIFVVLVFIGFVWFSLQPGPKPGLAATPQAIENYKALTDQATEEASKLFTLLVSSSLLPVFTTVLGYIFGSKEKNQDKEHH